MGKAAKKHHWPPKKRATAMASPTDAQLSRATGRPFGTKYDNIDQNKAKRKVLGR